MKQFVPYDTICIPYTEGYKFLKPINIICVEGAGKYCDIYCIGKVKYRNVDLSMTEMEKILPQEIFLRAHKSFYVSKVHVDFINRGKTRVYCLDDIVITIGRTYRDDFLRGMGL